MMRQLSGDNNCPLLLAGPTKRYQPLLILLLGSLLFACAAPVNMPSIADRPDKEALLLQLNLGGSAFRTLRGMAKGTFRQHGNRRSVNQVVLAQYPDKLRLETLGLFGSPLLLAATDGRRATVLLPGEGRAFSGPASPAFLQQFFGFPLSVEQIVATILLRSPTIVWQQASIEYLPEGSSRLILVAGPLRQEIDFNPDRHIIRVARFSDGVRQSLLNYADFTDGFPAHLDLTVTEGDIFVSLDFSDVELNIDHKPDTFRLPLPAGYRLEPFPQAVMAR